MVAFIDKLRVSKVQPCFVLPQGSNTRKVEALFPSELCFFSKDSYTLPSKEVHSGGRHAHDFSVVYPRWRAGTRTHVLCSPASSELSNKVTHRLIQYCLLTYTTCDPPTSQACEVSSDGLSIRNTTLVYLSFKPPSQAPLLPLCLYSPASVEWSLPPALSLYLLKRQLPIPRTGFEVLAAPLESQDRF